MALDEMALYAVSQNLELVRGNGGKLSLREIIEQYEAYKSKHKQDITTQQNRKFG